MAITWYNEKQKDGIATLYESNITLNKACLAKLEMAYNVKLGIDYEQNIVIIKPISKDLSLRGDIPEKELYKITIRASYGRISNKEFMNEIQRFKNISLLHGPLKFKTHWDDNKKYLVIDLNKEEN